MEPVCLIAVDLGSAALRDTSEIAKGHAVCSYYLMIFDIVIISLYDREKQIYSISSTKNVAFSELFRRDKK